MNPPPPIAMITSGLNSFTRVTCTAGTSFVPIASFVIGERFRSESKKRRNDKMLRIKQNRGHVMAGDTTVPLNEFADWNAFASAGLSERRLSVHSLCST